MRHAAAGFCIQYGKYQSTPCHVKKTGTKYMKPEYNIRTLELNDVIGSFYILVAGWSIAIVVLIFEIIIGK